MPITRDCIDCGSPFTRKRDTGTIVCPHCATKRRAKHCYQNCLKVWRANGGRCWWCGESVEYRNIHRDHIIPVSKGGGGGDNIVPSCAACNLKKNARDIPALALGSMPTGG